MKKIIKKISGSLFIVVMLFMGTISIVLAEEPTGEPVPEPITVNLNIRDGNTVIFSGTVPLPIPETKDLNDISGNPHQINSQSVLSIINEADILSSDFNITNLTYFDSFGSLYLKCIESSEGEHCDNWQYVINNSYPFVGMDQNILSGGEDIYVYFGPQSKIYLSSNTITTSGTLTVNSERYDYENNAWVPRTGVTIGLTKPDPSNPFSPIEISTSGVDANGQATFSTIALGTYNVGVKEDYYFPTEELTVTTTPPPSSSSSGGSKSKKSGTVLGATTQIKFDLKKAFDFLSEKQEEDGSFGEDIYTDWAILALATGDTYQNQVIKLVKYLSLNNTSGTFLTDYERRAMALMALGLNPYNTNGVNYIGNIISKFDGKQFGDINEDNDDIFALIVMQNAGFNIDDKMLTDDVAFVLNRQKENGSWDESVDMTGAAMQALASFNGKEEARPNDPLVGQVKNALIKAKEFLKQSQKDDGGWGNVSSTAWAVGGILALGETPEDWIKNGPTKDGASNTPLDYFAINQDTDGGIKNENIKNKIWETSYVVTALSGKTWSQIMREFEKPQIDTAQIVPANPSNKQTVKNNTKKEKLETIASQNTATVIATTDTSTIPNQPQKQNWFRKLLENIKGFFF